MDIKKNTDLKEKESGKLWVIVNKKDLCNCELKPVNGEGDWLICLDESCSDNELGLIEFMNYEKSMKRTYINNCGLRLWKLSIYWKDAFEDYAKRNNQRKVKLSKLYCIEIVYDDTFIFHVDWNRFAFRKL